LKQRFLFLSFILFLLVGCVAPAGDSSAIGNEDSIGLMGETATPLPPTATPAPTPNPYLQDESLQPANGGVLFGNGSIQSSFYDADSNVIVVQTALGVHAFDLETDTEIAFRQTSDEMIGFDGEAVHFITRRDEETSGDLISFELRDGEFKSTERTRLRSDEGEEVNLRDAVYSPRGTYLFATRTLRSEETSRTLSNKQSFSIWKDLTLQAINSRTSDDYPRMGLVMFSADEMKLALYGMTGGGMTSLGTSSIYLSDITDEGMSYPRALYSHRAKEWVYAMDFSSDSSMIASGDCAGDVYVFNLEKNTKQIFSLDTEEYAVTSRKTCYINQVRFPDNKRVVVATNTGKLVLWDLETGEKTSFTASPYEIEDFFVRDENTLILQTTKRIEEFNLETENNKVHIDVFENFAYGGSLVVNKKLFIGTSAANKNANLVVWDLETYSKIEDTILDVGFPDGAYFDLQVLQNGNILISGYGAPDDLKTALEMNPNTLELIAVNENNTEALTNSSYMYYSQSLNQYVARTWDGYGFVLAGSNDPVFTEILDRKSTLREIQSFSLSVDGSRIYVLEENGLLQVIDLVDPGQSQTIYGLKGIKGILDIGEDYLVALDQNSLYDRLDAYKFDVTTEELTPIAFDLPDLDIKNNHYKRLQISSRLPGMKDSWLLVEGEKASVIIDLATRRIVTQVPCGFGDKTGMRWTCNYYPGEGILISGSSGFLTVRPWNIQ